MAHIGFTAKVIDRARLRTNKWLQEHFPMTRYQVHTRFTRHFNARSTTDSWHNSGACRSTPCVTDPGKVVQVAPEASQSASTRVLRSQSLGMNLRFGEVGVYHLARERFARPLPSPGTVCTCGLVNVDARMMTDTNMLRLTRRRDCNTVSVTSIGSSHRNIEYSFNSFVRECQLELPGTIPWCRSHSDKNADSFGSSTATENRLTSSEYLALLNGRTRRDYPWRNGGTGWLPQSWGIKLNHLDKFLEYCGQDCSKNLWGGRSIHSIRHRYPAFDGWQASTRADSYERYFQYQSAVLVNGGGGSPIHWDTSYLPPCEPTYDKFGIAGEYKYSCATGINLQGTKLRWNGARTSECRTAVCNWAEHVGCCRNDMQKAYLEAARGSLAPHPFQSTHSFGWHTLGDMDVLEQQYGVPAHMHIVKPGDWYHIMPMVPHFFINDPAEANVSVATDDILSSQCMAQGGIQADPF